MLHLDTLIAKVISGNCTVAERIELNRWIALSEENSSYFEEKALTWKLVGSAKKAPIVNLESAWDKFQKLQDQSEIKIVRKSYLFYKIAAVFVVLLSTGVMVYNFNLKSDFKSTYAQISPAYLNNEFKVDNGDLFNGEEFISETIESSKDIKQKEFITSNEVIPQDSSSVSLTPYSVLSFLEQTPNQPRIASLSGAGMFNIKPLEREFVLETVDLKIKVQGTKFNIQTPTEENNFVEISVQEGFMEVFEKNNPSNKVSISSKEKYIYYIEEHKFVKVILNEKSVSNWKKMTNKIFKKNQ